MKHLLDGLNARPAFVALGGSISGLFSAERLAVAKDLAQTIAATLAGLCSLCALILVAPKAIAMVRSWFRPKQRTLFED